MRALSLEAILVQTRRVVRRLHAMVAQNFALLSKRARGALAPSGALWSTRVGIARALGQKRRWLVPPPPEPEPEISRPLFGVTWPWPRSIAQRAAAAGQQFSLALAEGSPYVRVTATTFEALGVGQKFIFSVDVPWRELAYVRGPYLKHGTRTYVLPDYPDRPMTVSTTLVPVVRIEEEAVL